jgi:hypothetical protein
MFHRGFDLIDDGPLPPLGEWLEVDTTARLPQRRLNRENVRLGPFVIRIDMR